VLSFAESPMRWRSQFLLTPLSPFSLDLGLAQVRASQKLNSMSSMTWIATGNLKPLDRKTWIYPTLSSGCEGVSGRESRNVLERRSLFLTFADVAWLFNAVSLH